MTATGNDLRAGRKWPLSGLRAHLLRLLMLREAHAHAGGWLRLAHPKEVLR